MGFAKPGSSSRYLNPVCMTPYTVAKMTHSSAHKPTLWGWDTESPWPFHPSRDSGQSGRDQVLFSLVTRGHRSTMVSAWLRFRIIHWKCLTMAPRSSDPTFEIFQSYLGAMQKSDSRSMVSISYISWNGFMGSVDSERKANLSPADELSATAERRSWTMGETRSLQYVEGTVLTSLSPRGLLRFSASLQAPWSVQCRSLRARAGGAPSKKACQSFG
mmetsp:Transcript_99954/g.283066  ORF Transcript_99954/g.283066 Transcript_99954/m.283066 type:complete len:216 (+) Transcript_99954:348-995(+)